MILSVSRRTDIPAIYPEWFVNRIKEGFVYVRNPMYPEKVSKINIKPDVVDCMVFWTKNPIPFIKYLDELKEYKYYFQYTITGYEQDIEPNLPNKKELCKAFKDIAIKLDSSYKVIWRYDPIFFNDKYTIDYHKNKFLELAKELSGFTKRCVVSILDLYGKTNINLTNKTLPTEDEIRDLFKYMVEVGNDYGFTIETCAEANKYSDIGVNPTHCIDKDLIEEIIGYPIKANKDKSQRVECGCIESRDIGVYNTCPNGCLYCYANGNAKERMNNYNNHNIHSPYLIGNQKETDIISEPKIKSLRSKK